MTFSQNGYGNASEQFNIAMEHVPLVEWFAYYVHCHFPLQTVRFPKATLMENHKTQISWYIPFWGQLYHTYIWANYNNSQTWNKAIWGSFPLLTIVPVRSQWGRYNLPRDIYIYISPFDPPFSVANSPHPYGFQMISAWKNRRPARPARPGSDRSGR